jgi:hypothetical protein
MRIDDIYYDGPEHALTRIGRFKKSPILIKVKRIVNETNPKSIQLVAPCQNLMHADKNVPVCFAKRFGLIECGVGCVFQAY